jgi:hypothetical protein
MMGQFIDLSNRLTNEPATIKIDNAHTYTVNKSKNAGILMMQTYRDDTLNDFDKLDKIIEIGLGKDALEYINSLNLSITQTGLIVEAIMAAINEVPLEEIEKEAQKAAKQSLKQFQK